MGGRNPGDLAAVNTGCTVIIATHNRMADLERTLEALLLLKPQPAATLICADGCTDGTVSMVRTRFPHCEIFEQSPGGGSIPARDRLLRQAGTDLALSLDDDSCPIEPDFLARIEAVFKQEPQLAVLTFPQRSDEFPGTFTQADFGPSQFVGTYTSSGAVLRREAWLQLGGYPTWFSHAYEEPDFALRCLAHGWHVRLESSLTVRHHWTRVQRNELRTHHRHARNEIWSVLLRCPFPLWCAVLPFRVVRQFGYAASRGFGWAIREPQWWVTAAKGIPRALRERAPVSTGAYLRWMRLLRKPINVEAKP